MPNAAIGPYVLLSAIALIGACLIYGIVRIRGARSEKRAQIPERVPELEQPQSQKVPIVDVKLEAENSHYVRLRREVIGHQPQVRFSVLRDWLSINMLAIFSRALRGCTTASDLIGIVPASLEAEAEILDGRILLIGTRGHAERLAIPIQTFDQSSELHPYFDFVSNGRTESNSPAVVRHSNGRVHLVSKGAITSTAMPHRDAVLRATPSTYQPSDTGRQTECIIVAGFTAQVSEQVFRQYVREFIHQPVAETVVVERQAMTS